MHWIKIITNQSDLFCSCWRLKIANGYTCSTWTSIFHCLLNLFTAYFLRETKNWLHCKIESMIHHEAAITNDATMNILYIVHGEISLFLYYCWNPFQLQCIRFFYNCRKFEYVKLYTGECTVLRSKIPFILIHNYFK